MNARSSSRQPAMPEFSAARRLATMWSANPGEHGLVGLDDQTAQRLGHALAGQPAHHGRRLIEEGGQGCLAPGRGPELGDVLRGHAGQPVEPLGVVRRHPGDGRRRQAALGQGRGAGQRVRTTAGPAGCDEAADAERVQDRRGVRGHVHHPAARPRRRPLVAGPGGQDDPQAADPGRLDYGRVQDKPDGSAVVQHQRQAIGRAGHQELGDPAVGQGDAASFGFHRALSLSFHGALPLSRPGWRRSGPG